MIKANRVKVGKIIESLLTKDVRQRAGCMKEGATKLKTDMENMIPKEKLLNDLVKLKYTAPWKPRLKAKAILAISILTMRRIH